MTVINVHRPKHKTHWELREDRVGAFTGKHKAQSVTISKGCESDDPKFGAIIIDGPVEGKGLSKVQV